MSDTPQSEKQAKRIAGTQPYLVPYFSMRHRLSQLQARAILKEHGPSRSKCDAAAGKLKAQLQFDEPPIQRG
jgi:hypothetical protein